MKTLKQWFDEYSVSHKNTTNKAIHYICVPAIYFSIIGLLMSIPFSVYQSDSAIIDNWAFVAVVLLMVFYARLSISMTLKMLLFSIICLIWNAYLSKYVSLLKFSILIFVLAWIGQFYGHKLEGQKPSFLKDLQFLLIGPAWVIDNVFSKNSK
jgi:uncharacterized membrane protein YGL010W